MQLSFGIYKKQLLFFAGILIVLGGIFYFVNRQLSQASVNEVSEASGNGEYNIDIYLSKDGQVKINDKNYNKLLNDGKEYDELRYIAADKEGMYIDQINILVHLPKPVSESDIRQIDYAVHGVGLHDYSIKDPNTLSYSASNLSPSATYTIVAQFSKGIFSFSAGKEALASLFNLPPLVWLLISISLPLATLVILFFMFRQSLFDRRIKKPKEMLSGPPNNLAPAEAGVLIDGRVSARSIAATLLDLAERDIIQIVNHDNSFIFTKKKTLDLSSRNSGNLKPFEKILLSKIFSEEELKSTVEDIQVRIGRHVFSRKIAEVYLEVYENVAKRGYFVENPSKMHSKYRKTGIVFFFLGLAGFIYGVFWAPDPKYYLIFWATMIFTSFLIIRMSPQLPIRTANGQKEISEWLKFKNFLIDPSPIGYKEGAQGIFERYLPYAIVFRCETEWSNRFVEHPFRQPDWYFSDKNVVILEDFVNDLFPVIGYISKELSASKEPIV